MQTFYVYLPHGETLSIKAEEYSIEEDQVKFIRDENAVNLYLNKQGVCIIPKSTELEPAEEPGEDEVNLFKSV